MGARSGYRCLAMFFRTSVRLCEVMQLAFQIQLMQRAETVALEKLV